jgi:hypothetical protein
MEVSAGQLRAVRAPNGWTQAEVADAAEILFPTAKQAEGSSAVGASANALGAIRRVLLAAGVILVEANGEGAAVRIWKVFE